MCIRDRYFPLGMEITDYPADFVNGCLIGAWDQLYQVILKERKDIPFLSRRTIIMNDNILDQELGWEEDVYKRQPRS